MKKRIILISSCCPTILFAKSWQNNLGLRLGIIQRKFYQYSVSTNLFYDTILSMYRYDYMVFESDDNFEEFPLNLYLGFCPAYIPIDYKGYWQVVAFTASYTY